MKNSKVLKGILLIAGLMLLIVGGATLFNPVGFVARNGVDLTGSDVSLMNDVRGSGAVYLACGLLILLGIFVRKLTYTSTWVLIAAFLFFGLGRLISIVVDGMPADGLVKATVVEIAVGLVGIFALVKYRE